MSAPDRFIAWCKQEQASIEQELELLATKRCPLTGKKTFASALTAVLASEDIAKRAGWLEVKRGGSKPGASIFYYPRGVERVASVAIDVLSERLHPVASEFGFVGGDRKSALSVTATLTLPVGAIAKTLREENEAAIAGERHEIMMRDIERGK